MDPTKDAVHDAEPAPPQADLLPVIPAGQAEERVKAALDDLAGAFLRLEGIALALARALDTSASGDAP